jgi:hypothetical protein
MSPATATVASTAANNASNAAAASFAPPALFNPAEWLQKVQDVRSAMTTVIGLKNPGPLLFTAVQSYGDALVSFIPFFSSPSFSLTYHASLSVSTSSSSARTLNVSLRIWNTPRSSPTSLRPTGLTPSVLTTSRRSSHSSTRSARVRLSKTPKESSLKASVRYASPFPYSLPILISSSIL